MKIKYLITASILLLTGCTINQENRIHERLTKQTGAYSRIKDIQLVADRQETDAFSFRLEQGKPFTTRKGSHPLFILKAEGLPLHERFILARIDRVTGQIDPQCEFEALEGGKLTIYGASGVSETQEIPFVASEGFKAGYPIDYVIVSKKTYASANVEFIPYPIGVTGEEGEKIEAIVSHPMGTHFLVRASGFRPSEQLTLVHTSGNLKEEIEIIAEEDGSFEIGLNPTILGRLGGEARLLVLRGEEKVTLDYPWGTGIEKKTWTQRAIFPMLFVANHDPKETDHSELIALLD